jgi:hypothetical protein
MTTLGDRTVIQSRSHLVGEHLEVEGARFAWHAAVFSADSRDFRRHVPRLVLACEDGETDLAHLQPSDAETAAALAWADAVSLTLIALTSHRAHGTVFVASAAIGGFVDESMRGFSRWLSGQLESDPVAVRSVAKLRDDGRQRQHLFLRVHDSAVEHSMFLALTGDVLPTEPVELPNSLTDVWILADWMSGVLVWSVELGWRRAEGWHDETFHKCAHGKSLRTTPDECEE